MEERKHSKVNSNRSLIVNIIKFIGRMIFFISNVVFAFIYSFTKERKIPPVSNPLLRESAVSLAEKIRTQKVSAEEIVRIFIERTKEVNPIVNALVDERFKDAIEEAKEVDNFIRSGTMTTEEMQIRKPLLGIPFTAKEEISSKGSSWTKGLVCRKGKKGTEDAAILQGLKNAGAILIGLTNIPEFCAWVETRNLVFGQTSNPYNTNRTAGGSSGGEASLVSCCGSPIGLGSDLGGSIRIPSFFCGVYGHKLSGGLISSKGMLYRDGSQDDGFTLLTSGTISRYAADLKPSSAAIVSSEKLPILQLDVKVDAKKLKYHYILDPKGKHMSRVDSQIQDGIKKLISLMTESNDDNVVPQEVSIPSLKYCFPLFMYWVNNEKVDLSHLLTDNQGSVNLFAEFPKKLIGKSNYTLSSLLMILQMKFNPPAKSWAENETKKLKEQMMHYLEDGGILLMPGYPATAPYHYQPFTRLFDYMYFGVFNILQFPVTQVPIGIAKDGLPFGIQVVAAQNQDRLCFAVAEYIESLIGGWVPPFSS